MSAHVVVTGSIATDHLMRFAGRFADQLVTDRLHTVSLSFLVDRLTVRRGGVAANIAYGMARLGLRPTLVGAVGPDFAEYRAWLEGHGVDCDAVRESRTAYTARFICTTDDDMCQIASFYPGAMAEAADIDLAAVVRPGETGLVAIGPDDPTAMVRHAEACRRLGVPFAADPSQQLAVMSGEQIAAFVTGARYLLTNEYEHGLMLDKLGVSDGELSTMVDMVLTTHGPAGVRIRADGRSETVPAVPVARVVDPTGAGDAFRAGFLAGVTRGLPPRVAAAVGCQVAAYAITATGTQEYDLTADRLVTDLRDRYDPDVARATRDALTGSDPRRRIGAR
ncbi:carbohydrate kinase family protein [Micromonospora aurantiaca]|uniref:carbohydrate kinase family protein n=1 Tax=Micromonospora TaxID=1873 RepID=UPI0037ACD45C